MVVTRRLALLLLLACGGPVPAGVLPDDRADALYHSYDGGGVEIDGPSILVLKKVGETVALSGNYYVDSISSASIDVVTTASPYTETRTEMSGGVEYLHGNSVMSVSYTNSDENDYTANTAAFGISVDMFGDMTTVFLQYGRGWDTVKKNDDASFSKDVDRQNYRVGLTQVVTKDMLMEFSFETVSDDGFLNNPYRSVRYVDPDSALGYSFEPERYPRTRTSNAAALRSRYFLPWRAALHGEYRFFDDTWGIRAHNVELGYTHTLGSRWILDFKYRYYTQSSADFYSDLFPRANSQNFMARDKELSDFHNHTAGVALSYEFAPNGWHFVKRGSLNIAYDRIWFNYDNFRDLRETGSPVGQEPLYDFAANVAQAFISIWF